MKENYKGFNISSFYDKEVMYGHATRQGHDVDDSHQTGKGWVYLARGKWWDENGEIIGFDWVV
jgi:hypothetical protein